MFLRLRGDPVTITPLLPEEGNVWPGPQKPDPTLQEIEAQQQKEGPAPVIGGGSDHQQPRPAGSGATGPAPPVVIPGTPPTPVAPPQRTRNGTAVDTTGGQKVPGYRELQPAPPAGKGILVPNGNGTSTLIGPDGSVSTVPTKPVMVRVLYFAWLRERAGRAEEHLTLPPGVATIGALAAWLRARDEAGAAVFNNPAVIRAAVNQRFAAPDAAIADGDEVAFFPPVTGG